MGCLSSREPAREPLNPLQRDRFFRIEYIAEVFQPCRFPLFSGSSLLRLWRSFSAYRKIVEGRTDELVHVSDPSDAIIAKQAKTAEMVQQLDRVVLILTILFIVYGIALGGVQIYQAMNSTGGAA